MSEQKWIYKSDVQPECFGKYDTKAPCHKLCEFLRECIEAAAPDCFGDYRTDDNPKGCFEPCDFAMMCFTIWAVRTGFYKIKEEPNKGSP